jgi:frataxin-like iron-binding protein CyaY
MHAAVPCLSPAAILPSLNPHCSLTPRQRPILTPVHSNTSVQEFDAAHHHFLDALQSLLESPRFESLNLDVALSDGVLSVASPNHGTWVLNKHGPTRQLWLSSPVSGPAKFNFHRELEHGSGPASAASAAAAAPVSSVGEGWRGERDHNDSLKVKLIREWTAAFKQTIDPVDDFPPPH